MWARVARPRPRSQGRAPPAVPRPQVSLRPPATETAPGQSPTARSHAAGIRLQHRRRQRIEHQHRLGLQQRPAQLLVIFRRADPGQARSTWCSAPECCPRSARQRWQTSGVASWFRGHCSTWCRPVPSNRRLLSGQRFSWAWNSKRDGIAPHRLGQQRLHVPGVGDDDIIRLELSTARRYRA